VIANGVSITWSVVQMLFCARFCSFSNVFAGHTFLLGGKIFLFFLGWIGVGFFHHCFGTGISVSFQYSNGGFTFILKGLKGGMGGRRA